VPLVLSQHFRGNLDNWDPALVDARAVSRCVMAFDNVGVAASGEICRRQPNQNSGKPCSRTIRAPHSPLEKEFDGIFERAHIEEVVNHSAKQLEAATVASFVPILAHRFARERLRAQAQAQGKLAKSAPEVVFVSITGGGRARIAASLLQRITGDTANIHTAGSGISLEIDPNVRTAMEELGIDLSDKFARPITDEVLASADIVVTMGHSVGEIDIPAAARHLDWRVGDPAGAELDEVRRVRSDIERRVIELATELQLVPAGTSAGTSDST
jgi:protein-tyrosine-phosphatase